MVSEFNSAETAYYFERFGFCGRQIDSQPIGSLGMVLVLPAYNEENVLEALKALYSAERPQCGIEVIVVFNSKEGEGKEIVRTNALAAEAAIEFGREIQENTFRIHVLNCVNLPKKKSGVGLARKIGMDEALRRFDQVKHAAGVIVCFDADCVCDSNYFVELEKWFSDDRRTGCSIYFEHPLKGAGEMEEAITLYELHLRYYVQGLRFAGFPYAFHTIGSSMAVRADVYRKQGGMNTRQAGEDFYFLHKIIPLGEYGDLAGTRVIPSPRASERVPFGTGRAVGDYMKGTKLLTYHHQSFFDLKTLFEKVDSIYQQRKVSDVPASVDAFLAREEFDLALGEMLANASILGSFRQRFFRWFDGFQTMKFLHFARDAFHPNQPIEQEAAFLHPLITGKTSPEGANAGQLLKLYRTWERENPYYFKG